VEKVLKLGVVESIEHNHKKVQEARKKTGSVAVAIGGDPSIMAGRHFDQKDKLASVVSRRSIDCLKEHFRDEVTKDEWSLVVELKKYFGVI
jgi:translation initiation factor 5B